MTFTALIRTLAIALPLACAHPALHAAPAAGFKLDHEGLVLNDVQGRPAQRLALRAKHLDTRTLGHGPNATLLAVMLDADSSQPVVVSAPATAAASAPPLQPWPQAPQTKLSIETLCLHLDAQGLPNLFLIAEDGRAEQWLLRPQGSLLLRHVALPIQAGDCVADDERAMLLVAEPALGVWAYDIGAEGSVARQPLALRHPWGTLDFAPHRLQLQGTHLKVSAKDGKKKAEQSIKLPAGARPATLPIVLPRQQTAPVARLGDAADDPAIWVHPERPGDSRVLATNKKQGLLVYDLQGAQTQLLESGRLNNVDLRQRIRVGNGWRDLAVATQRDEKAIVLFEIDAKGVVAELARLPSGLDDLYGICAARNREDGLDVFANDKDGRFVHLRLTVKVAAGGRLDWHADRLRSFRLASQPEGCVVDEPNERLFVGEEDRGIWALSSRGDVAPKLELVLPVGPLLKADVEGLAVYRGQRASWLVASSQGNDSYVVIDALPPFTPRGAFRIGLSAAAGIDGASETDGLDVTSATLGADYPQGLLVVQDGHKRLPDGPQNFKYVSWQDVMDALRLVDR
ncbi:MAG TPA: phytase [Ideonella sp.]|uniref:phytase n=1 Tax=Ideonella sp. TaxID=1929293 RepID=UPI002E321D2C|nr:phytase [Ideonella sp.]HEX5683091.1 phytase [Ideonella sp.]